MDGVWEWLCELIQCAWYAHGLMPDHISHHIVSAWQHSNFQVENLNANRWKENNSRFPNLLCLPFEYNIVIAYCFAHSRHQPSAANNNNNRSGIGSSNNNKKLGHSNEFPNTKSNTNNCNYVCIYDIQKPPNTISLPPPIGNQHLNLLIFFNWYSNFLMMITMMAGPNGHPMNFHRPIRMGSSSTLQIACECVSCPKHRISFVVNTRSHIRIQFPCDKYFLTGFFGLLWNRSETTRNSYQIRSGLGPVCSWNWTISALFPESRRKKLLKVYEICTHLIKWPAKKLEEICIFWWFFDFFLKIETIPLGPWLTI